MSADASSRTIQLFATCIVDALYPEVGEATVKVLERLGYTVEFPPGQTCCGLPLYNNGFHAEARRVAENTICAFAGEAPVVVPSGSCGWMLKKVYPSLVGSEQAERFAARVHEFSAFIEADSARAAPARCPGRLAYSPSCHLLRGLGVTEAPKTLLKAVPGAEVVPLGEECCGFGGTFAIRYDEVSSALLADRLDQVSASGAGTLVVTDPGCLMHLDGGAHRRGCSFAVRHLAEVLADDETGEP